MHMRWIAPTQAAPVSRWYTHTRQAPSRATVEAHLSPHRTHETPRAHHAKNRLLSQRALTPPSLDLKQQHLLLSQVKHPKIVILGACHVPRPILPIVFFR